MSIFRQNVVALVIGSVIAVGIMWIVGQTTTSQQRSDHALLIAQRAAIAALNASQAAARAREAQALAKSIAEERAQGIMFTCAQQNREHDATVHELDRLLHLARHRLTRPAQRRQLAESRQFTILLIDRLAPKRDCRQVVQQLSRP